MSPFCIVGIKPLYKCRSEPQIAVDVILTIASCLLRICGSGTSSTRISFLPYQQLALIIAFLSLSNDLQREPLVWRGVGLTPPPVRLGTAVVQAAAPCT